jgi:hypothetical protein
MIPKQGRNPVGKNGKDNDTDKKVTDKIFNWPEFIKKRIGLAH